MFAVIQSGVGDGCDKCDNYSERKSPIDRTANGGSDDDGRVSAPHSL